MFPGRVWERDESQAGRLGYELYLLAGSTPVVLVFMVSLTARMVVAAIARQPRASDASRLIHAPKRAECFCFLSGPARRGNTLSSVHAERRNGEAAHHEAAP